MENTDTSNKQVIKLERLDSLHQAFNWREIPDDLNSEIEERFDFAKSKVNDQYFPEICGEILFWYKEFQEHNLRYLVSPIVDRIKKYTPFYNVLRELSDISHSSERIDFLQSPWQIVDLAIIQMEYDLNCRFCRIC